VPLLETRGLTVSFGGLVAVNGVSFALEEGEILGLIGPNGAGKTTCFNLISGFLKATAGEVVFRGENLVGLPPHAVARRGLVRTFQKQSLFPGLTALENVMIGRQALLRPSAWRAVLRPGAERAEVGTVRGRAGEALAFIGLAGRRDVRAGELAYGDQRRLAIGIALAAEPRLLMLDEPAAGMNPRESAELRGLIGRIRDAGVTVLLVEHDMSVVMNLADRVVVLDSGRKIAEGKPREIRQDPEVIRVYLGETATRKAGGATDA
jgi:branched-chain amino acid transport system ATP-binding protein